jgi:hypothetical protein
MTVPAHDGKGQPMVPGGRFMAENDTPCEVVGWQAFFFAQSSVLSTHYLSIETLEP